MLLSLVRKKTSLDNKTSSATYVAVITRKRLMQDGGYCESVCDIWESPDLARAELSSLVENINNERSNFKASFTDSSRNEITVEHLVNGEFVAYLKYTVDSVKVRDQSMRSVR